MARGGLLLSCVSPLFAFPFGVSVIGFVGATLVVARRVGVSGLPFVSFCVFVPLCEAGFPASLSSTVSPLTGFKEHAVGREFGEMRILILTLVS